MTALSDNKRPISAETLYDLELVHDPQISPDGRQVVFAVQRVDRVTQKKCTNLWLVAADGSSPARQLTRGEQRDSQPRWSPDGRQLAFLSNRDDELQAQLYLLPLDGGDPQPVTQLQGHFASFAWSPDGSRLLVQFRKLDAEALARKADPQAEKLGIVARRITTLDYKLDEAGYFPEERWHLWRIDTADWTATQLTDGPFNETMADWSPDGSQIVFVSNRSAAPDQMIDATELYVISAEGGEIELVDSRPGRKSSPVFSPDGKQIAYLGYERPRRSYQNYNLYLVDAMPATGTTPVNLNALHGLDVHLSAVTLTDTDSGSPATKPVWLQDGSGLLCHATERGSQPIWMIPISAEVQPTRMLSEGGIVGSFSLDSSQTKLAYLWGTPLRTGQVWLRSDGEGSALALTDWNSDLFQELDFGTIEEMDFSNGDQPLHGWILKPPGFDPAQRYPTIVEIHGGPMTQYGRGLVHEFHVLAAQGYLVAWSNPRGSQGYGEAFAGAIYNNWGTVDYEDVMAWTDTVAALPYVDSDRMGVAGGSYGGYMTATIIGRTDRFKAAVAQRVVVNWISFYGASDMNWRAENLFGGESRPWEDLENFWRQSPISRIGNATTPTLVVHSEQDLRCPQEQGEQLFVALKRLGVDTELLLFPEEPHGLSRIGRTDRRIVRLQGMVDWFERYLK